jgi:hypothetical protein
MARILVEYEKALSGKRDSGAGVSGVNGSGADISGVNGSVADGFSTGVSSGEGSGVSDVPGRTASGLLGGLEDFPNVVDENGEPADSFDSDRPDLRFSRPFSGPEFEAELAAVEARHTNADGTRKATWMKAPNGNPTNLTHRQWLEVRTESFKAWFGDWESLAEMEAMRGLVHSWLTKENLDWAKGRTRVEIFSRFGNELQAIAYVPEEYAGHFSGKVSDNRVYSGMGYFIDHAVNHHAEIPVSYYDSIQDVLNSPDEVLIDDRMDGKTGRKRDNLLFLKKFTGNRILAVSLIEEAGNRIVVHKSFFENGGKKPYPSLKRIGQSSGGGRSPISHASEAAPGGSLPARDVASDSRFVRAVNPENVSKFVDDNFEPKVFYHRPRRQISIFDIGGVFDGPRSGISADSGWLGTGFYFYGEASELDGLGAGYGPDRYPVFLNVRSPHYATLSENRRLAGEGDFEAIREFSLGLRDEGKDGVYYNGDLLEEAVVFDPRQIKSATDATSPDATGLSDSAPSDLRFSRPFEGEDDRYLAVLHNLSEDNLFASARLGGLAVPSLAITDVRNLYGIYGEITLIGDSSLADPQQPGNKVFSADAWTPTHPPAVVQGSREDISRFYDEVVSLSGWGEKSPSLESSLGKDPTFAPVFLEFDKDANDDSIPRPYLTFDGMLSRAYLREAKPPEPSKHDMLGWLNGKLSKHNLWQGIEDGVNPDGSPRIVPYNLENVVRHLTRGIRYGGKTEGFRFNGFKAFAAKEFGRLDELKADREKVTNQTEAVVADSELKQELSDILDLFGDRETSFYDNFYKALVDYAGGNSDAFSSLVELTPEMKSRLDTFISHFRSLPVAYFEGKPQRAVRLDEFKAAVVPQWSSKAVFSLLRENGIDVFEYETGNERQAQTLRAADDLNLRFSRPFRVRAYEAELAAVEARHTNADGTRKDTWMKAPNGKPTKLTQRQWLEVRTPSFKAWFGDWEFDPANASKALDENGEPRVVFHGASALIRKFSHAKLGSNTGADSARKGFFFAGDRDTASAYNSDPGNIRKGLVGKQWSEEAQYRTAREAAGEAKYGEEMRSVIYEAYRRASKFHNSAQGYRKAIEDGEITREEAEGRFFDKYHSQLSAAEASQYHDWFSGDPAHDGALSPDGVPSFGPIAYAKKMATILVREQAAARMGPEPYKDGMTWDEWRDAMYLRHRDERYMPLYLNIRNPLRHDFKEEAFRDESYSSLLSQALNQGNDGAIFERTYDGGPLTDILITFTPNQIKSAVANRGSFDEENPDIRFSRPVSGPEFEAELAAVEALHTNADGTRKATWMKAPNGKPTNLTQRQWLEVRTPSFKAWFGDWEFDPANASKALDENGEPLVVYHGTRKGGHSVFLTNADMVDENARAGLNIHGLRGAEAHNFQPAFNWFSSTRDYANAYTGADGQIYEARKARPGDSPQIYAAFLNARNPRAVHGEAEREVTAAEAAELLGIDIGNFVPLLAQKSTPVNDFTSFLQRIAQKELMTPEEFAADSTVQIVYDDYDSYKRDFFEKKAESEENDRKELSEKKPLYEYYRTRRTRDVLRRQGYDSITASEQGNKTFGVPDSNQIKSATDNSGAFDAENPDIRFSRPVEEEAGEEEADEDNRYLAVLHNLSADNLLASARLGGLAVPSLAITDVRNPFSSFGEITLVGDPSMADPEKLGNRIFSDDAYTSKYPPVKRDMSDEDFGQLYEDLLNLSELGEDAGPVHRDLKYNVLNEPEGEFEDSGSVIYNAYLRDANPSEPSEEGMVAWLQNKIKKYHPYDAIYYKNGLLGEHVMVPLTLKNLLHFFVGKGKNFLSGHSFGHLRAAVSKEFNTFSEVKADRGRVVGALESYDSDEDLKKSFRDLEAHFKGLELVDLPFPIDFEEVVFNHAKGDPEAFKFFKSVSPEDVALVDSFLQKVRESPVRYFEGKPQRAVMLDEFMAAVVPEGSSGEVISLLEDNGIEIFKYKLGNNEDRQAQTLRAAEDLDLRFSQPISARDYKAELAAVEALHTNADGTRKDTWLKAPNGKPSKLSFRQWLQVRTPAFKAWFGDWEAAAPLPNSARSFDDVRGVLTSLSGRVFTNRSSGLHGSLSKNSINKLLSGKARAKSVSLPAHLHAAANIIDLFERGEVLFSEPGSKGEVKTSHKVFAPFVFDGKALVAKVTVQEYSGDTGNRIYSVEAMKVLEPVAGTPADQASSDHDGQPNNPLPASTRRKLREMAESVNPEKFLNVLDENGEPVVSNGSFDAQNPDIRFSRPVGRRSRAPRDLPPDDRYLAVLHNLSASKLFSAARLGGLAVPSLAITDVRNPHTGFGDITLLGDSSLADPQQPGNKVFSADVYSPTFPRVERSMAPSDFKRFHKEIVALSGLGRKAEAFSQADIFEDKFSGFYHNTLRAAFNRDGTRESRSERKKNAQTKEEKWSGNRPQRRLRQKFLPPMVGRKKLRVIIPENATGKI